jgi:hypothetical protein
LVDLDGDGHLDVLSGSWPGELFLFRGGPDRTFAAPVKLKDRTGKTINIGGGIRENSGNMILVAGDATFEETDKGYVIIYEGKRIEIPEGKQGGITGTASTVHASDWDGDGDLDLLVGEIGGKVYLVPNETTGKGYAFGKEQHLQAGGKPIVVAGDAGPFVCDWDGDGDQDLLVGAGDGSVSLFRNEGTNKKPRLARAVQLVSPSKVGYGADAPRKPRRGSRAKVCVADWNGDGRLDLLLGDYTTQKPDLPEPTAAEKAVHDKLRKELAVVQGTYSKLVNQLIGRNAPVKDKEERKKLQKELNEVAQKMSKLRAQLPQEYETHGWVWLFLRQPSKAAASTR